MESLFQILTLALIGLIVLVSISFGLAIRSPNRGVRLRVKTKHPFVMPSNVCVVTGEGATQMRVLRSVFYTVGMLRVRQVSLPFSEEGYRLYVSAMPISLRVCRQGYYVCSCIPLLGMILAMGWAVLGSLICCILAVSDIVRRKRQLVTVNEIFTAVLSNEIRGLDLSGVCEAFATETLRLNTGESLSDYLEKSRGFRLFAPYTSHPTKDWQPPADIVSTGADFGPGSADAVAGSVCRRATVDPKADGLLEKGVVAETNGDWDKAMKFYAKLRKRYPGTTAADDADARIQSLRAQGRVM